MGFISSSWDLPDPGVEPVSPESLALAGRFFITEPPGKQVFVEQEIKEEPD